MSRTAYGVERAGNTDRSWSKASCVNSNGVKGATPGPKVRVRAPRAGAGRAPAGAESDLNRESAIAEGVEFTRELR